MEITVWGLNHTTAPVDVREKFAVPSHRTAEVLEALRERNIFDERVLLSTCNRTEIYGVTRDAAESARQAKAFFCEYAQLDPAALDDKIYLLREPHSVEHLFRVASGLNSMVLGETEITGQVKDAYLEAHKHRQTGKVLNNLFQRSLRVAKHVRSKTEVGSGRVSVASVAVDLADKIFESMNGTRVIVIGTGQMATQVTRAIVGRGAKPTIVSSRHFERAQELARELGGQAAKFEDYPQLIEDVDIVIASTQAPKIIIGAEEVRHWMRERHDRPLFMIDIAVPRNIDSAVEKIDNVYLYNIDDLESIAARNRELRQTHLEKCFSLVTEQTGHFMAWVRKEFGLS